MIDSVQGKHLKKVSAERKFESQSLGDSGRQGINFVARMDIPNEKVHVKCGNVTHVMDTLDKGTIVALGENIKALFRPTLYMKQDKQIGTRITPVVLGNWASFMTEVAYLSHGQEVSTIRATDNTEEATALLVRLCHSILNGKPSKAYVMEGNSLNCWKVFAGMQKVVVLDVDMRAVKGTEAWELSTLRGMLASRYLVDRGTVARECDTSPGKPGMEFFRQVKPGRTVVTQFDPCADMAPAKRSPYFSAMAGAEMLTHGPNMDWTVPECVRVPFQGRKAVVAVLPICSDGTVAVRAGYLDELSVDITDTAASKTEGFDVKMPVRAQAGSKIQSFIDGLKGVICPIPDNWMPWVQFADGTRRRADIVISLNSKSHHQVAHTVYSLALNAAAERFGGLQLENYDAQRVIDTAIASQLYREDCLEAIHVEKAAAETAGQGCRDGMSCSYILLRHHNQKTIPVHTSQTTFFEARQRLLGQAPSGHNSLTVN